MDIDESTLSFGPDGGLIGVLTRPASAASKEPARVGCLLLNVGLYHRIGPRRINVKAARQLALEGIPSLRFDLSGVGDSRASASQSGFREQALADMKAALDEFQKATGLSRFIVLGICSGGANGMTLALDDERVVGLLMFDGYIFLTPGVRLERKLRRWAAFPVNASIRRSFPAWTDWMAWARAPLDAQARQRALGHITGRLTPRTTEETGILDTGTEDYDAPGFIRDMGALVERGVDVYLLYSATLLAVDHGRDLLKGLGPQPFLDRLRYEHCPDIDHTATTLASQRKLIALAGAWAQRVNAAQPTAAVVATPPAAEAKRAGATLAALERRLAAQRSS